MAEARSRRPRIGITTWRRPLPTPLGDETDLYTLGVEYADAVTGAGGLALLLPHDDDPEAVLEAIDGLLLSGGGDVDPRSYGEPNRAAKDESQAADRWEVALVRGAQARGLPVLGICRGMQILAVASGGRLDQDIAGAVGHPEIADLPASAVLAARHDLRLEPASTLGAVYGIPLRQVNTIHHQAVVDPGALKVTATGPGGVIEGIEATGGWCALGVQWHPEKLPLAEGAAERPLFEHLVAEARAYARGRQAQGV